MEGEIGRSSKTLGVGSGWSSSELEEEDEPVSSSRIRSVGWSKGSSGADRRLSGVGKGRGAFGVGMGGETTGEVCLGRLGLGDGVRS